MTKTLVLILLILSNTARAGTLEKRIVEMADDPSPRVRFQLALTLGDLHSPEKIEALAKIAVRDSDDHWTRIAILSSVSDDAADLYLELFKQISQRKGKVPEGMVDLVENLARTIGAGNRSADIARLLKSAGESLDADSERFVVAGLRGLLSGFSLGEVKAARVEGVEDLVLKLLTGPSEPVRQESRKIASIVLPPDSDLLKKSIDEAVAFLQTRLVNEEEPDSATEEEEEWEYDEGDEGDEWAYEDEDQDVEDASPEEAEIVEPATLDQEIEQMTGALRRLGLAKFDRSGDLLGRFLSPRFPTPVQVAALETLDSFTDPGVGNILVDRWRGLDPLLREKATDFMFARKDRLKVLLSAIESGRLKTWTVDRQRQSQLFKFPDKEISETAKRIFTESRSEEDPALFETYRPALELAGDPEKGHEIYRKRCTQCHKVGDEGVQLGPDWRSVKANTREALMTSILYPNRLIAPGFTDYVVETNGGQIVTGLIKASGNSSITLRRTGGEEKTILRRNIRKIEDTKLSLMPVGLQEGLTPQDMANLLSFIQSLQ